MFLEKISIINFKNIEQSDLVFSNNINCLLGNNGTGKTNLLDAIYFLSIGKSALNLTDGQCVNHDNAFFMLEGNYLIGDQRRENIVCSFRRGGTGKVIKRNGKEYDRMSEHIGLLPIVMVSPSDTALINESADERRRFLNTFLSQIDRAYLSALVRYNHLLAERNKLLKNLDGFSDVLTIIDMQMVEQATVIFEKRKAFTERLSPIVSKYYRAISDDREDVQIDYRSDMLSSTLTELLAASAERDRIMGHTTVGVHRDDLLMSILGYPIRKYGSQGQQKCILIAMKLAQYDIVYQLTGIRPILLLDDVFDKLDFLRVERLIEIVSGDHFGQIFITDSNKIRIENILNQITTQSKLFNVENGIISEISNI